MNFSEKLKLLRKNKGYTQEELAERLNVSRIAVAKWEAGHTYPDIANLIQISNMMNVSVDYLVKEQECMVVPTTSENNSIEDIIRFRLEANVNTYAAFMNEVDSTRLDSHDYRYEKGEYVYHDTYVGGEQFAGEEAVWKAGKAVYAMNYMGRVLDDKFSGNFLKEALHHVPEEKPFRGPDHYASGDYSYQCDTDGDFAWFQGKETICYRGEMIYECYFHGGMIR